jgi:pimeloyl-ACP methyl ester carboxylesterase
MIDVDHRISGRGMTMVTQRTDAARIEQRFGQGVVAPRRWTRTVTFGLAVAVAVASGLLTALLIPRGPTSAGDGLIVMALGFVVGALGGALTRSRLVFVALIVAYAVALELGRLDAVEPTIRDIRLDSPYGILALVFTRGVHALLLVVPMAFGVGAGRWAVRGSSPDAAEAGRARRPLGAVLLGLATAGLALLVAWPASTPPVLGPDGEPVPGSIAELTTVSLGGADHAVMIRAADPDDPVILYLAGGPGQSDMGLSRALTTGWVEDFVYVNFDQRGNGKSYAAIDPVSWMTIDRAVADVIELTDYLRTRFEEDKVYLMGESWGTILGVLAVRERPDLFHAWIGSGQMVDVAETDARVYRDLVAYAERTGDMELASRLEAVGEPPYSDIPWANANLLAWYEYLYKAYTPSASYIARGEAAGVSDPFGILLSEYDFIEKTNVLRGLIDTFTIMFPQLYEIDLREDAASLEVPVYVLDGVAELEARRGPMLDWFEMLEAPEKRLVTLDGAAHAPAFEQADAVQRLLTETIVPATYGR